MFRIAPLAVAVAVLSFCASARADGPASEDEGIVPRRAHAVLARYDVGSAAQTFGVGYARTGLVGDAPAWWALGVTTGVTYAHEASAFQAGQLMALARGAIGHSPPFGAELGLGAGIGPDGVQGIGQAGAYLSVYFVDLGYAFAFPLGPFKRPPWLASHQFSLRITVPFVRR
jgi:hypothetical protein